jgi:uncharacterized membrane protein
MSLLLALFIMLGNQGWKYYLQVILGFPFVIFFPGYSFIASLFPKRGDLGGIERLALSFGLSVVIVPLIGLLLNYTSWGIRLIPTFITLLVFILVMSGIALIRRRKLPAEEQYFPSLEFQVPVLKEITVLEKLLAAVLVFTIILAIGGICYAVVVPKNNEKYTEFYILGPDHKADNYPINLSVGETGSVILGIFNHEQTAVDYSIQVRMGDYLHSFIGPVAINNEQKWENPVTISASMPHQNLKVEFLLFRQGESVPYHTLDLWVNVHNPTGNAANNIHNVTTKSTS